MSKLNTRREIIEILEMYITNALILCVIIKKNIMRRSNG